METDPQLAPSVVSVTVVHEPGDWFDETLSSFAAQDYPNLRSLFLVDAPDDDALAELAARIRAVLPTAFVRPLPAEVGFGPAANEVLRLVEGDNGFFLITHDDVALAPGAVRLLVAELFRSNAGIVGPKLVDWDEPRRLQHVGLGLDRFGEVDPIVDPGEYDQEQHDAVRDVFVLPSACLLVRADLFRTLGGFDPAITFHGEDIDLCWRAHHTGARVIVVPDAVVRHREQLEERRPDLRHRTLRARHRMRAVATLTGGSRLLGRSIQLVLLTLVELVVGLFSGRFADAAASLRALGGLIPRTGSIIARRRSIRGQRMVHEREVMGLQVRGSSRLTSYLRGRETTTYVGADSTVRRWREASFGPPLAWFLVVLGIVIGSRSFIRGSVPTVGEFLPLPDRPGDLWAMYASAFDGRSFGSTSATPTGWALAAIAGVLALFQTDALLTFSIVGGYVVGAMGAWRLATVFPVNRARIAAMVVYVGTPLVPGLLGRGDWSALAWYAALPWLVHLLRRTAGLEAADPAAVALDLPDGVAPVGVRHRLRAVALLCLALAAVVAFVPSTIVLWAVVGALLSASTLLALGSWRVAAWLGGGTAVSVAVAFVLNLPWSLEWRWSDLAGPQLAGSTGRSLPDVASLAPDTERFAVLAVALYLPLVASLAISRAWRLTWSVRAASLVLVFGVLMVMGERGSLGVALPPTSLLAVPVALGLALGGAAIAGGFGSDVLERGFGWRQPVAILANAAIVVGVVPAVLAIGNGAWHTPRSTLPDLLAAQLPADVSSGEYRALVVGDPRVLPVPARELRPGIAYAVVDSGPLGFTDRFPVPATEADEAVERVLTLVADGSTLRAGRLLAPLGIRYVVVPLTDGVASTPDDPIAVPAGLVGAFQNQLDIGSIYGPPSLELFVNQAWFPVGAQLTGATAEASRLAGEDALARADVSSAVASMIGSDRGEPSAANEVAPGVLHLAVPFDDRIALEVDGRAIPARPGFGVTTAFDVEAPGTGVLGYRADGARGWWLASQITLWLVLLIVAAGARAPFVRRRTVSVHDETLIDLGDEGLPAAGVVGEALAAPAPDEDGSADIGVLVDSDPGATPVAGEPAGETGPGTADGTADGVISIESEPGAPVVGTVDEPPAAPAAPARPWARRRLPGRPATPSAGTDTPPAGIRSLGEGDAARRRLGLDADHADHADLDDADGDDEDDVDLAALVARVDELEQSDEHPDEETQP